MSMQRDAASAECIKVAVRVRPFSKKEDQSTLMSVDGCTITLANDTQSFTYDLVYWMDDPAQKPALDLSQAMLDNALGGFNSCLFAYGQTGSGKTRTIFGGKDDPGVVPRTMSGLFEEKQKLLALQVDLMIWFSCLQIYSERVHDLLHIKDENLPVRDHPSLGVHVPGALEVPCDRREDVDRLLAFAVKRRAIAATRMNDQSSRSHVIVVVKLQRSLRHRPRPAVAESRSEQRAHLKFFDLAGSERYLKPQPAGKRLFDSCAINKGLNALHLLIRESVLLQSKRRGSSDWKDAGIPYRASKLTFLLQDALVGNSKTRMVAAVRPGSDFHEETISTLRFARSVQTIKTVASKHSYTREDIVNILQSELAKLQAQLPLQNGTAITPRVKLHAQVEEMERFIAAITQDVSTQTQFHKELHEARVDYLGSMGIHVSDAGPSDSGKTPYLINMADDPSLAGALVFYLPVGEQISVGSARDNFICITGMSISERMCIIENLNNHNLTISKCSEDAHMSVDGQRLQAGCPRFLMHGHRLRLGRKLFLKLAVPERSPTKFSKFSRDDLELKPQDIVDEWTLHDSPTYLAVEDHMDRAVALMPPEEQCSFRNEVLRAVQMADEANEISAFCRPHDGLTFEVHIITGPVVSVGISVSKFSNHLYFWNLRRMTERLDTMRECYQIRIATGELEIDTLEDPWFELHSASVWEHTVTLQTSLEKSKACNERLCESGLMSSGSLLCGEAGAGIVLLVLISWHRVTIGKYRLNNKEIRMLLEMKDKERVAALDRERRLELQCKELSKMLAQKDIERVASQKSERDRIKEARDSPRQSTLMASQSTEQRVTDQRGSSPRDERARHRGESRARSPVGRQSPARSTSEIGNNRGPKTSSPRGGALLDRSPKRTGQAAARRKSSISRAGGDRSLSQGPAQAKGSSARITSNKRHPDRSPEYKVGAATDYQQIWSARNGGTEVTIETSSRHQSQELTAGSGPQVINGVLVNCWQDDEDRLLDRAVEHFKESFVREAEAAGTEDTTPGSLPAKSSKGETEFRCSDQRQGEEASSHLTPPDMSPASGSVAASADGVPAAKLDTSQSDRCTPPVPSTPPASSQFPAAVDKPATQSSPTRAVSSPVPQAPQKRPDMPQARLISAEARVVMSPPQHARLITAEEAALRVDPARGVSSRVVEWSPEQAYPARFVSSPEQAYRVLTAEDLSAACIPATKPRVTPMEEIRLTTPETQVRKIPVDEISGSVHLVSKGSRPGSMNLPSSVSGGGSAHLPIGSASVSRGGSTHLPIGPASVSGGGSAHLPIGPASVSGGGSAHLPMASSSSAAGSMNLPVPVSGSMSPQVHMEANYREQVASQVASIMNAVAQRQYPSTVNVSVLQDPLSKPMYSSPQQATRSPLQAARVRAGTPPQATRTIVTSATPPRVRTTSPSAELQQSGLTPRGRTQEAHTIGASREALLMRANSAKLPTYTAEQVLRARRHSEGAGQPSTASPVVSPTVSPAVSPVTYHRNIDSAPQMRAAGQLPAAQRTSTLAVKPGPRVSRAIPQPADASLSPSPAKQRGGPLRTSHLISPPLSSTADLSVMDERRPIGTNIIFKGAF